MIEIKDTVTKLGLTEEQLRDMAKDFTILMKGLIRDSSPEEIKFFKNLVTGAYLPGFDRGHREGALALELADLNELADLVTLELADLDKLAAEEAGEYLEACKEELALYEDEDIIEFLSFVISESFMLGFRRGTIILGDQIIMAMSARIVQKIFAQNFEA
jgi:hypothetical protein